MDISIVTIESFKKWLQTLGYAASTAYDSTNYIKDFFFYLKEIGITEIEQIQPETIKNYYQYLQIRSNKRNTGSLSNNYIVCNINALKRFSKYLQVTGKATLDIDLHLRTNPTRTKTILTPAEIKALYKACDNNYLGMRDRAILSIYYGCGLRRNEGVSLDVKDILLKEKLVYVRKGKYYKERYVPITEAVKEDLEQYIYIAREKILTFKNIKTEALFLSIQVKRIHGNSLIVRLRQLLDKTGIHKAIGLHSLRHSIATHLLQSGMTLEEVSSFLGHASLESTQIYTHIANE